MVPSLATWCDAVRERRKMEPGGIEPPSRDSQQSASTRVSGDLISDPLAATGSIVRIPALSNSSPAFLSTTHAGQPGVLRPAPYQALDAGLAACFQAARA